MKMRNVSRRQFLQNTLTAAGAVALGSQSLLTARADTAVKRTASDQVTLGKTGIKLSRLGMGTGSTSGHIQRDIGQENFNSLIRYCYDQGITYFDCAQSYQTFEWLGSAIKGLPREKLFIQSKIGGNPEDVLAVIDHHRKVYDTDYVDSMLVHCMVAKDWTDKKKRMMDAFDEAKQKGWIRAKGVSCHSLPALRAAAASQWTEVHLVRVNPQGKRTDAEDEAVWSGDAHNITPVVDQIKAMHEAGHGVIGMKIIGDGMFTSAEDREKSVRFAMSHPEIDAVVIGFKNRAEVDEAIQRINNALS